MDTNHPARLVLCVVAAVLAIIAGARLFERLMRRRQSGWLDVVVLAATAIVFGAGAALVPDVSRGMRAWIATCALAFACGSLGTALQWPGFRPPPPPDDEDDLEEDAEIP
jgi:hypothetical protein